MTDTDDYIAERKRNMGSMIDLYCRKKHSECLCDDCRELKEYAFERIESCMNNKSRIKCTGCPGRCYRSDMRDRIQEVVRFSRPRMILHPGILLKKY